MLEQLNDNHVMLMASDPERFFNAGYLFQHFGGETNAVGAFAAYRRAVATRPVPDRCFPEKLTERAAGAFAFGWAAPKVGYFHLNQFSDVGASAEAIDELVEVFGEAEAILIDVRHNGGGDDRVGKLIADRFADEKRLYMTTRDRRGPGHGDFTPPKHWYVEPGRPVSVHRDRGPARRPHLDQRRRELRPGDEGPATRRAGRRPDLGMFRGYCPGGATQWLDGFVRLQPVPRS